MTIRPIVTYFAAGLALAAMASARALAIEVSDVTGSFGSGPYSALAVSQDGESVAVGTTDGRISWIRALQPAGEEQVQVARQFDAFAMRGTTSRSFLAMRGPAPRATRLYLYHLERGTDPVRWAHWMAIGQVLPQVVDVSFAASGRPRFAATQGGLFYADPLGAAWSKVLGPTTPATRSSDPVMLSVAVNPSNSEHLLTSSSQGTFVSFDGGRTFREHPFLATEAVLSWRWSPDDPAVVVAIVTGGVMLSGDGGASFSLVFGGDADVRDVLVSTDATLIATSDGLHRVTESGTRVSLRGTDVLGVARVGDRIVVATADALYEGSADGDTARVIARMSPLDPIVALRRGSSGEAWAITRSRVFRLGEPMAKGTSSGHCRLRMRRSLPALERRIKSRLGLGEPEATRFHDRWFARLLPRVTFDVVGSRERYDRIERDGALPTIVRHDEAGRDTGVEWAVWAHWDLSAFLLGQPSASNPNLIIESQLRANRTRILTEVRRRYRNVQEQARATCRAPTADLAWMWATSLEEDVAYLEFLAGEPIMVRY